MIPARCASTIFVDNPSDAAVKRLLAEWADADFFEPHDIIRTVILQADIANLRSLVLTLRFPVLFPFWKIRGLGIKRANAFAINIHVDEISFQGYPQQTALRQSVSMRHQLSRPQPAAMDAMEVLLSQW